MGRLRSAPAGTFIAQRGEPGRDVRAAARRVDVLGGPQHTPIRSMGPATRSARWASMRASTHRRRRRGARCGVSGARRRLLNRLYARHPRIAAKVFLNLTRIGQRPASSTRPISSSTSAATRPRALPRVEAGDRRTPLEGSRARAGSWRPSPPSAGGACSVPGRHHRFESPLNLSEVVRRVVHGHETQLAAARQAAASRARHPAAPAAPRCARCRHTARRARRRRCWCRWCRRHWIRTASMPRVDQEAARATGGVVGELRSRSR